MNPPRKTPRNVDALNHWVELYAREQGEASGRVRSWVSYMIIGGALTRAGFAGVGPKFTIKGAVAQELRLRSAGRATKDLDLILNTRTGELIDELETALEIPYEGFSFRRKGEAQFMPNGAARVRISLDYSGKAWATVQIDIAHSETDETAVEMVEAISLRPFGLQGPDLLPCLTLPEHVAQKIHAMTLPPPEGRQNERFRDLVDLILLREWVTDYGAVRKACQEVFVRRAKHPWPPFFEPPDFWEESFAQMAIDLELPITDLYQAAIEIRYFIQKIDESALFFADITLDGEATATTWYFAVGADGQIHRVPVKTAEALLLGDEIASLVIPKDWQRTDGGVALIGVVAILEKRRATFIERTSTEARALNPELDGDRVYYTPDIWLALAEAIISQAKAPRRAIKSLAAFLSTKQGVLPCAVGERAGISSREAHKYIFYQIRGNRDVLMWDLYKSRPVKCMK